MNAAKTHTFLDFKHGSPLISCRFDPSGKHVFYGAEDYRVWRYTLADKSKAELNADAWVRGIAFTNQGRSVVTGGYDGRLIWAPVEGKELKPSRVVDAHDGWVRAVASNPDGKLIASVGNDLMVKLWNAGDGKLVREMRGHESHIYNVAFHPDGKRLVSGDLHCNLIDWEVATGKKIREFKAESLSKYDKSFKAVIGGVRSIAFSPDGKRLACSGITNVSNAFAGVGNPSVVEFDWEQGKQSIEHLSKGKLRGVGWGVAVHPDGTVIACVGGSGGHLLFWKPDGPEEFHALKLKRTARDLDLAPDNLTLATGHSDGYLRLHRMAAKG